MYFTVTGYELGLHNSISRDPAPVQSISCFDFGFCQCFIFKINEFPWGIVHNAGIPGERNFKERWVVKNVICRIFFNLDMSYSKIFCLIKIFN
jgi:hypothetical protein